MILRMSKPELDEEFINATENLRTAEVALEAARLAVEAKQRETDAALHDWQVAGRIVKARRIDLRQVGDILMVSGDHRGPVAV